MSVADKSAPRAYLMSMRVFAFVLLADIAMELTIVADGGSVASEAAGAAIVGALLGLITAPIVLRRSRDWAAFATFHEALARR